MIVVCGDELSVDSIVSATVSDNDALFSPSTNVMCIAQASPTWIMPAPSPGHHHREDQITSCLPAMLL